MAKCPRASAPLSAVRCIGEMLPFKSLIWCTMLYIAIATWEAVFSVRDSPTLRDWLGGIYPSANLGLASNCCLTLRAPELVY